VATALGLEQRVETCRAADLAVELETWARTTGDPLADPSFLPTMQVSRHARRFWTVALSGDGGDELLSGYPRLRAMPRIEQLLRIPTGMRRWPRRLLPCSRWASKLHHALQTTDSWSAYQALQGVWPRRRTAELLARNEVPLPWSPSLLKKLEGVPPWTRWRALDVATFLPERMLAKVDRAAMSTSLEVRVPLLDHRIVELLLGLPDHLTRGKDLLRRTLDRFAVPQPQKRKVGFEIPLGSWLRSPAGHEVKRLTLGQTSREIGLRARVLEKTWYDHQTGRADYGERLLAAAILARWVEDVLV